MKIRTPYSPLALFAWQRDDADLPAADGPPVGSHGDRDDP